MPDELLASKWIGPIQEWILPDVVFGISAGFGIFQTYSLNQIYKPVFQLMYFNHAFPHGLTHSKGSVHRLSDSFLSKETYLYTANH